MRNCFGTAVIECCEVTLNRITIAHLITELNTGGAERMLEKLVSRMDRNRFRSIVVSMTDIGPIGENIIAEKVPVFNLGMISGRANLIGTARYFRFLRRAAVDIIQSWLYHADLLGLLIGKLARVKRIVWGIRCSDMDFRNYRALTSLTVKTNSILSFMADAIVINSVMGKRFHKEIGYRTKRMILIPNGFDTEKFYPDEAAKKWLLDKLGLSNDVVLIGNIARWDPMKDQENFLKAASLLSEKEDSVHYVMVGLGVESSNKRIKSFVNNSILKDRLHLLGLRKDVERIMAALDIVSSSSAYGEGFPSSIGEAMACGVPCVVTDVGDSERIVGKTGRVVPSKDPQALANAWKELIDIGQEGRRNLGFSARKRIKEHFEISEVVKQYEALYTSLMRKEVSRV
jgi:glycosyltransferase involved in cell wall biosynthesis